MHVNSCAKCLFMKKKHEILTNKETLTKREIIPTKGKVQFNN